MKKLNVLSGIVLVSVALFLGSCEGDETHNAPVITFDATSPVTLGLGVDSVTLTGTIVAEAGLEQVKVFKVAGLSEVQLATITEFSSGEITTTDDINYSFRYVVSDITAETTVRFEATDKDAQEAAQSIVVQPTAGSINSYTAILLGAQSNAAPSALDAYNGIRYSFNSSNTEFEYAPDHKADIDIIYYYGSSNLATLAAPADPTLDGSGTNSFDWTEGWSPKNETLFGSTSLAFDQVNYNELALITGLTATKMTSLAIDDVIAFQTVEGNKGLIRVSELTTGSTGTITINVKIQQ